MVGILALLQILIVQASLLQLDLQDAYDLADWIVGKRKETGARKE